MLQTLRIALTGTRGAVLAAVLSGLLAAPVIVWAIRFQRGRGAPGRAQTE